MERLCPPYPQPSFLSYPPPKRPLSWYSQTHSYAPQPCTSTSQRCSIHNPKVPCLHPLYQLLPFPVPWHLIIPNSFPYSRIKIPHYDYPSPHTNSTFNEIPISSSLNHPPASRSTPSSFSAIGIQLWYSIGNHPSLPASMLGNLGWARFICWSWIRICRREYPDVPWLLHTFAHSHGTCAPNLPNLGMQSRNIGIYHLYIPIPSRQMKRAQPETLPNKWVHGAPDKVSPFQHYCDLHLASLISQ